MSKTATLPVKFVEWIGAMTMIQFHLFCGLLWDIPSRRFQKWEYWKGVRGFPGQAEVAEEFEQAKIAWVLKARQLGLSELAGEYAFKVAITEPRSEILVISKTSADAKYFLKRRILPKIQAAYALEMEKGRRFPWPKFIDNTDTGKILFDNGSFIEAVSSDNEQVRSRTPRLVIFDEIRSYSHKDAAELWSAILPAIQSNPSAQMLCISSAKFGSWFNEVTKRVMTGKMPDVSFLFLPTDTCPDRTPEWRKREANNWPQHSLYLQEHPMKPEDCFVSREGAVFPQFDPKPGGRHVHEFDISWAHQYIIGYDHGRQHPAVLLLTLYSRHENHLYVFDELFCRGMELPQVAYAIRQKLNFWKEAHGAPPPQRKYADSACFAKDGRRTVAETLRELTGVNFQAALKHDINVRIDRLSLRFSQGLITIHPRCEQLRRQIEDLRWKNDPTESKKETPEDIEDDGIDILGYIDSEINASVKKIPEEREELFDPRRMADRDKIRRALRERTTHTIEDINAWQAG